MNINRIIRCCSCSSLLGILPLCKEIHQVNEKTGYANSDDGSLQFNKKISAKHDKRTTRLLQENNAEDASELVPKRHQRTVTGANPTYIKEGISNKTVQGV
jgi:hypothetical protein